MLITPTANDFISKANYYRGVVIHTFIHLEKKIEYILSEYFVGDSHRVFRFESVILDRMNFENKRTSLKFLFDKIEIDLGFAKSKNNAYPNKDFFNELRLLNDQRNHFAHYFLALPTKKENAVISLEEFRDNGKSHEYTESDIQKIVDRISDAHDKLESLWASYKATGIVDRYNSDNYYEDDFEAQ